MKLPKLLVDLVARTELKDITTELAEHGLDAVLDDGVVKEVPFFGTLAKLWSAGGQIRDIVFTNKLQRFLVGIAEIPREEREELISKLDEKPEEKLRVGEHLLSMLERLDDSEKAEVIGVAFIQYLRSEINLDKLQRINVAVDRCHLRDLRRLNRADLATRYPPEVATMLSAAGAVEIATVPTIRGPGAVNEYITTPLGQDIRALLDEHFPKTA